MLRTVLFGLGGGLLFVTNVPMGILPGVERQIRIGNTSSAVALAGAYGAISGLILSRLL